MHRQSKLPFGLRDAMAEDYSMMVIAWLFVLLLGGCVLINAAVDLGAREFRRWLSTRRNSGRIPRG
jgi:hypothetical protein